MTVSPLDSLPPPHPGELWYSLAARDIRNRGESQRLFRSHQLLGKLSPLINIAFPNRVGRLVQFANHRSRTDDLSFARSHTLLPYQLAFDAPSRLASVVELSNARNLPLSALMGTVRSPFDPPRLRYCRSCVDADTSTVGEPYWHVAHQLPFVVNCRIHGDRLWDSQVPYSPRLGGFWTAHRSRFLGGTLSQGPAPMSHALARGVARLTLAAARSEGCLDELHMQQSDYLRLLRTQGFEGPSGTVAASRLDIAINQFAVSHGMRIGDFGGRRWWRATYTAVRQRLWPVQHIVMRLFLLERIWQSPRRDPFDRGWETRLIGDQA